MSCSIGALIGLTDQRHVRTIRRQVVHHGAVRQVVHPIRHQLGTFALGVTYALFAAAVLFFVLSWTTPDSFWMAWSISGLAMLTIGALVQRRARSVYGYIGLGIAAGSLVCFAGLFVTLAALGLAIGS